MFRFEFHFNSNLLSELLSINFELHGVGRFKDVIHTVMRKVVTSAAIMGRTCFLAES